ncbi:MAG: FtsX-like permease family protein [Thermosulfidibacteraceae bacterium]|jgi:lipoprotein-releasing system permease protein
MNLELFLALKYLKAKKGGLISFGAIISIIGIMLSVASLIIVISVMTGFTNNLKKTLLGASAHIYIVGWNKDLSEREINEITRKLEKFEWIRAINPFVYTQAILKYSNLATGLHIKGVIVNEEAKITSLPSKVVTGNWNCISQKGNILVGKALSENLALIPGDKIVLITPKTVVTPFGMMPVSKEVIVCGVFDTGMYNIDSNLAVTSIDTARELVGLKNSYTGLQISVNDPMKAVQYRIMIERKLKGNYVVKDWITMNRSIFSALKLEKLAMFLILTLMVLVASFSIVSTLSMTVVEKERDIAILATMGMTPQRIRSIFMIEGLVMGLVGTVLGVLLGITTCFVLERYPIISLPKNVYYIDRLPVEVNPVDIAIIVVVSIIISLISTYLPAKKADSINPVEVLRLTG